MKYVKIPIDQNTTIVFEYADNSDGGIELASGKPVDKVTESSIASFERALHSISVLAESAIQQLQLENVHEVSLEFGIRLTGDLNVVVLSGGAEVHIKTTVKWVKG